MQIDLRVLELLSSKICHDLISPVSAINNGVELIEDIGGSVVEEAMKLIANSAVQSSRRLRVFRIAYGRAGSEENLPLRDVRLVCSQYFEGGKIKLVWPEDLVFTGFVELRGSLKTLINTLILAEELLAYGGEITVKAPDLDSDAGCLLELAGRGVHMPQNHKDALDEKTSVEDLTPRTIQAYMTGRFASHFGLELEPKVPAEERLVLAIKKVKNEYDDGQSV